MTEQVRSMKKICALLHETRRRGDSAFDHFELEGMIRTAEELYHRLKESQ